MSKKVFFFGLVYFIVIAIISLILNFLSTYTICYVYDIMAHILLTCLIVYHSLPFAIRIFFKERVSPRNKAVFISGCDSGFGHALAKRLDSKGFHVFAGCLFPDGDGAKALKEACSDSLHVIGLNITKNSDVKAAVDYVKKNLKECELWAIVNNAGMATGFELEWTTMKEFEVNMDINGMGTVRVTKAFLSLLRRSKGRVVTVTSVAGRMCFPYLSPYCMSKYAASCFCDCLRIEMQPWGVKVVTIEPENFKTAISDWNNKKLHLEEAMQHIEEDVKEDYGSQYFQEYRRAIKRLLTYVFSNKTYKVVNALEDAVSLEEPCNSYTPCRNIFFRFCYIIGDSMPKPIRDFTMRFIFYYLIGFPQPNKASSK